MVWIKCLSQKKNFNMSTKITLSDIRDMEFHDVLILPDGITIIRVHNGWIYYYRDTSTFVPYNSLSIIPVKRPRLRL
jgi:hypothetical protein